MQTFQIKQTVFHGALRPLDAPVVETPAEMVPEPPIAARYWAIAQSLADLRDPQNSPSVCMWGFLLASAQTQRLNEISIYVGRGTTREEIRFLYMNDCALSIWRQMEKPVRIKGRSHRPPRAAVLSFGMPFAE